MSGRTAAVAALALVASLTACSSDPPGETMPTFTQQPGAPAPTPDPEATVDEPMTVASLVTGLEVPWGVAFLPDGDAVVTERDSTRLLRVSPEGSVTELGQIDDAEPRGEAGLLGVAVSPDFATDSSVFLYVTTDDDNRVLRATLEGDGMEVEDVVLDSIPAHENHDGGRLAFGPDGFLYVTTGDARDEMSAQDPDSLAGKILRITADGDAAPGNPTPGSPVWSMGHRNVQGLAWDDEGRLWASEFGSQTWDELNLIEPGKNYGWPHVEGTGGGDEFVDPQLVWSTDQASPSGLAYADGHLWMAALRGNRLWRIKVTDAGKAVRPVPAIDGDFGRLRAVATTPDGNLWVTTSNLDGRGDPQDGDDRILLVTP